MPAIKNLVSSRYLAHRALNRFLSRELDKKRFGILLDIGSGQSPYKKFIHADKYISLDIENRSGNPDTLITDLNNKIPLTDNYGDCVILTEVLEHLKDPSHSLKEIYRVLKKDGLLVLTTPMVWPVHEVPNDFYRYTSYGLEHLLKNAGFSEIVIRPGNGYITTCVQMLVVNLRRPAYKPIVLFLNAVALILRKFDTNYQMPICNLVTAKK